MERVVFLITAAAVLLAGAAAAATVILNEDFETPDPASRWTFWPFVEWRVRSEPGRGYYMSFSGSGGGAESRKNVLVKKGETYKVGLDYRSSDDDVEVTWGDKGKFIPRVGDWTRDEFVLVMGADRIANLRITIGRYARPFDFDNVLVVRCDAAVSPASLGRVKALFK
jgi:hypothetical protein